MTPSCLRVDKAIIFFISHSPIALYPAINMVMDAIKSNVGQNQEVFIKKGANRINKNTPAVTRVDE